jgi:hypothetical protein
MKSLDFSRRGLLECPKLNMFSSLIELDISRNDIQRLKTRRIIIDLPNLEVLDVSFNSLFVFADIAGLGSLPKLRSLNIDANPLPISERSCVISALLLGEKNIHIHEKDDFKRKMKIEVCLYNIYVNSNIL